MKAGDSHSHDSPFNPPKIIRARALFVLHFFAMVGGLGCAVAALSEQAWSFGVPSVLCLMLMFSIRLILRRNGLWQVCVDGLNEGYMRSDLRPNSEDGGMRLIDLIDRRKEIERLRGGPEFDPWALQEVRHEINELVKANPALAELLDDGR